MCAIIDANVVAESFGHDRTPAGQAFRESVDQGKLRLVVGSELLEELDQHREFRQWRDVASRYGRVHTIQRNRVEPLTEQLRASDRCESNDEHVIALAQASGAGLLFSNDRLLHRDFKDRRLVEGPRGKVFTTREGASFTRAHRRLLGDRSLCRMASIA